MIETEADLQKANLEYMKDNWYWFLAQGLVQAVDIVRLDRKDTGLEPDLVETE